MNSVSPDRVGAASGINNAVARVAGVLAIAVLGIVMVNAFGSQLNRSLDHLALPPDTAQQIKAEEIKLAGLKVPAGSTPTWRTPSDNLSVPHSSSDSESSC